MTQQFVRNDSLFFPQELTFVTQRARERYRPLKWRAILPVESVPSWAQTIEDRRQRSFIEDPINTTDQGPTEELPEPAMSVSNQFIKVFNFGYSYSYTDQQIEFASKVGIALEQENVDACNLGAETFLEKVASVGHTATGMKGLGNLADVSTATAANKAVGSDTPWNDATSVEIVTDLHTLVDAVVINSKERQTADTVVMPLAQYQRANVVMSSALERTPLEIFRAQRPEVRNIFVWDALKTSGASSTPCAMAWDSRDPYGPRFIMAQEFTYGQPLRLLGGWRVPGYMRIGGVVCRNPTAVVKMSGL